MKFATLLSTFCCFLLCIPFSDAQVSPTEANSRMAGFETRKNLQETSLVKNLPFENIGPTIFSGRIVDVEVNPDDPTHFYAAYASGGLWFTKNNGTSLSPVFDQEAVMTIGDIAVDWDRNIIWLGSGENNSSRSSYAGLGMYKSIDSGKTWSHQGLDESHHISRVILHPDNQDVVWVAALGALYSPNENRGVYKTTDGGKTWEKVLFVNENCGAVDLTIDPQNPDILYAATWERERRAWDFNEGGQGSGIYKSVDGGETWTLMTNAASGFPRGELVGRIGLDMYHKGDQEILYAILDNYNRRPPEDDEEESKDLTKESFREMTESAFLELDDADLSEFLKENDFPEKYSAEEVKTLVEEGNIKPIALVEYLEDANSQLFDTPVIGAEVYRSEDGGESWTKMNEDYIDFLYNSYGYYFGQVRVSPHNPDKIYVLGVPVLRSDDGGKTYTGINGDNVHSDHHALWLNPSRDEHIILGNDGGLNISYDDGATWTKQNDLSVGQFYSVAVDMAKPYNVYGGLQDNGVWMGPNTYTQSTRWHSSGKYPYKSIMGGDGMQVAIDTRDNETVYTGFQFGNYYRVNTNTGERTRITPKHELGDRPYRWNWESPIWLSEHNQDIFYMGSNKLHRSMNQGEDFEEISDDLTQGGKPGDVPFGTLASLHESPLKFGLLYTGSDDGYAYVTKDGGNTWTRISDALPQNMWIASIQASAHSESRVYISLNGYRSDHFEAHCYISDNYGQSWTRIGTDLPVEPVNVLKEDPKNEDVVYVGTDHGAYVSLNRGRNFMAFSEGLPNAPIHDLVIHPRENDLILATHGRSFFKGNVEKLQSLTSDVVSKDLVVFELDDVRYSKGWGRQFANWRDANEPETSLSVYSKHPGQATVKVLHEEGLALKEWPVDLDAGLNFLDYDYSFSGAHAEALEKLINTDKEDDDMVEIEAADNGKFYLPVGTYQVEVINGSVSASVELKVTERRSRE